MKGGCYERVLSFGTGWPRARHPTALTSALFSQGFQFLPKTECDVREVEIARALRLSQSAIEPVAFRVPRVKVSNSCEWLEAAGTFGLWCQGEECCTIRQAGCAECQRALLGHGCRRLHCSVAFGHLPAGCNRLGAQSARDLTLPNCLLVTERLFPGRYLPAHSSMVGMLPFSCCLVRRLRRAACQAQPSAQRHDTR